MTVSSCLEAVLRAAGDRKALLPFLESLTHALLAGGALFAVELVDEPLGRFPSGPPVALGHVRVDVFELDLAGDRAVGSKRDLARERATELARGDRPLPAVDVRDRQQPGAGAAGVLPGNQVPQQPAEVQTEDLLARRAGVGAAQIVGEQRILRPVWVHPFEDLDRVDDRGDYAPALGPPAVTLAFDQLAAQPPPDHPEAVVQWFDAARSDFDDLRWSAASRP